MKKIVNPCKVECYDGKKYNAFAEIVFTEDGRLSIHGVVGPMSNGNCRGSAGQCQDSIRSGCPNEGWNDEMLAKFCDIWSRWHLNDMNPACEHQRELGWVEMAKEKMTLYHYRLTNYALKKQKEAENAAIEALRKGETFEPTYEQTFYSALPYSIDTYVELGDSETRSCYEEKKRMFPADTGFTETKFRGWVKYEEDDRGILCRPCPVCGYKYGTEWLKEDVPQEVIDWLFNLPETKIKPAWV